MGQFDPSKRGSRSKKAITDKIERRARRVIEIWGDRPSLLRNDVKLQIQEEFDCGIVASDVAIKRAYEIMRESRDDAGMVERIAVSYFAIHEEAKRAKDWTAARKALDSLRAHLGIGSPDRVEHSGGIKFSRDAASYADLSDEELEILAKLDELRKAKTEH